MNNDLERPQAPFADWLPGSLLDGCFGNVEDIETRDGSVLHDDRQDPSIDGKPDHLGHPLFDLRTVL